ncbi:MAG: sel1 repeat family protein [Zoogloeaceae bacterium]|jgi:TPR repeat protein|nr:sel1 repeat family protein [Zoogloeaceae bacterium]
MADLPRAATLKEQLAFEGAYEKDKLPPLDPELDQLFKRAVWIYKQNRLKDDPEEYAKAERLYRIAAAHGHYRAMNNLTNFILQGRSVATGNVDLVVDMTEDLIQRGIPVGYFNMGVLLDRGYGVKPDERAALQYFRKAADLGNPEAQYYVGSKLRELTLANPVPFEIGNKMLRYAAEQGHAQAAVEAATNLKVNTRYPDAVKYYQLAVKAGSSQAAYKLSVSFLCTDPTNWLHYLALEKDEERSRRYKVISDILEGYDYLGTTVEEIDRIVPLPPAKLPPWDGQLEWVQHWNANVPPRIPDEERIAELAKAKGLDPTTGRPLKNLSGTE